MLLRRFRAGRRHHEPDPATLADCPRSNRRCIALEAMQARVARARARAHEPIAIVGIGCRFPGAPTIPTRSGAAPRRRRRDHGDSRPSAGTRRATTTPIPNAPGEMSTRWGGFLDGIDRFEPPFFGISPREAARMDPQQRLLLEVAWEALEHAGIAPDALAGSRDRRVRRHRAASDYAQLLLRPATRAGSTRTSRTGIARSVAAGRLSYVLGLHGPSLAVDTACSSSLVAVHLACQSLRSGRVPAGARRRRQPDPARPRSRSRFSQGAHAGRRRPLQDLRRRAPTASCAARAAASSCSSGCRDALADGDRVLAVIRGSAVNQDGRSSGLTAPNGPAQEAVIREALAQRGRRRRATSTTSRRTAPAPRSATRSRCRRSAPCSAEAASGDAAVVGSVKTNIGHLEAAAGVAGLIKVVLVAAARRDPAAPALPARRTRTSPGTSCRSRCRPSGRPWPAARRRALAGVSSFGFSGTNAHVVLEEAPPSRPRVAAAPRGRQLLVSVGAHASRRCAAPGRRLCGAPERPPDAALADVCFTANVGRRAFGRACRPRRRLADDSSARLDGACRRQPRPPGSIRGAHAERGRAEWRSCSPARARSTPGMGRQLYDAEPVFRAALDECERLLEPRIGRSAADVTCSGARRRPLELDDTPYTQPALFALEYALAELWRSLGGRARGRDRPQRRRVRGRLRRRRLHARGRRCALIARARPADGCAAARRRHGRGLCRRGPRSGRAIAAAARASTSPPSTAPDNTVVAGHSPASKRLAARLGRRRAGRAPARLARVPLAADGAVEGAFEAEASRVAQTPLKRRSWSRASPAKCLRPPTSAIRATGGGRSGPRSSFTPHSRPRRRSAVPCGLRSDRAPRCWDSRGPSRRMPASRRHCARRGPSRR